MGLTEKQIIGILEKYDISEYNWKLEIAAEIVALQRELTKDISDDMIEKWAYNTANKDDVTDFYDNTIYGKIIGAKSMQSGEIARWAKKNGN